MRRTFLLTGGTGFLGSRLSLALLERGDRVVFLGRSKNKKSLAERVHNNLTAVDSALVSQSSFDVLEVDLLKPDLGLPPTTLDRLRKSGVAGIWHAAADLSFEAADRGRVFSTNVLGTSNAATFGGRCCFLRLLVTASQPLLQHPAKLPGSTAGAKYGGPGVQRNGTQCHRNTPFPRGESRHWRRFKK